MRILFFPCSHGFGYSVKPILLTRCWRKRWAGGRKARSLKSSIFKTFYRFKQSFEKTAFKNRLEGTTILKFMGVNPLTPLMRTNGVWLTLYNAFACLEEEWGLDIGKRVFREILRRFWLISAYYGSDRHPLSATCDKLAENCQSWENVTPSFIKESVNVHRTCCMCGGEGRIKKNDTTWRVRINDSIYFSVLV